MQVVAESSATIPVAGKVYNYNSVLGQVGITGLKTGNNNADYGAFLFAAHYNGQIILGVTLGASSLPQALHDSVALLRSAEDNLQDITVVHQGQIIGLYSTPWNNTANATAGGDITVFGWKGTSLAAQLHLQPITVNTRRGEVIGSATVVYDKKTISVPLELSDSLRPPSIVWRIVRLSP